MKRFKAKKETKTFLISKEGPVATEYVVMLASIILSILVGVSLLGQRVEALFANATDMLPG